MLGSPSYRPSFRPQPLHARAVKRNEVQYGIPLTIVSYKQLYNWTMDEIVAEIGRKNNCTFCGVFRRQALDRGAAMLSADKIVTGHNADDIAETVLMNSTGPLCSATLGADFCRLGVRGEHTDPTASPAGVCFEPVYFLNNL